MGIRAQAAANLNHFDDAQAKFGELLGSLQSAELASMTHAEAEEHVLTEGREALRLALQGYVAQRGRDDAGCSVVGSDGVERTHHRVRSVPLHTVVGRIQIVRETYGARGHASLAPLDGALNLPRRLHSFGVQKRVAAEVARGSYEEAVNALQRQAGVSIATHQAEDIAGDAAQDFDAFYERPRTTPVLSDERDIITLTTDGKGVAMRPEGLREATRKAAAAATPKLRTRLSKGEKRHRKRMALVASVYGIAPFIRKPEDIIRDLQPVRPLGQKRPRPQAKRVWASIEKSVEGVIDDVFHEALRRDPERKKPWVVLVDGNVTQLGDMLAFAEHYQVNPTVIIDIIHVAEYLWKAAWAFHQEGTRAAEVWVRERLLEVLRGRASYVAAGIRRSATRRNLAADKRGPVDTCADYLLKYKDYMRYNEYLAAGFPIATGVIEGACRYLVKDRMDLTGARWSLKGAEAVLRLRALHASGDFDEYWRFHQDQQHERNHHARYAGNRVPDMAASCGRTQLRIVR
jgi:hypothetical protein